MVRIHLPPAVSQATFRVALMRKRPEYPVSGTNGSNPSSSSGESGDLPGCAYAKETGVSCERDQWFESIFLQQRVSCELGLGSSIRPGAGSTDPQSVSVTAAPSSCPRKQSEHPCRQLNCCNVLFGGYEPIRRSVSHE